MVSVTNTGELEVAAWSAAGTSAPPVAPAPDLSTSAPVLSNRNAATPTLPSACPATWWSLLLPGSAPPELSVDWIDLDSDARLSSIAEYSSLAIAVHRTPAATMATTLKIPE